MSADNVLHFPAPTESHPYAPKNLHCLIVGRTGSGKTTLAKWLARLSARVIVLDRKLEYSLPDAVYAYTLPEAVDLFCKLRWQRFALIVRLRDPSEYTALLEVAMYAQEVEPHGPLVIVAEEFSAYSETQSIDPTFHELYNAGRHLRVSLITVIQLDTDVHRVTRGNAGVIVSMSQKRMSVDMSRYFTWQQIAALVSMSEPGEYTPEPEQGRHYVTDCDLDLPDAWADMHGVLYRPVAGSLPTREAHA